jgi:hypothetical protein
MGYFTIDLPENKKADVRWGTVFKKHFLLFGKRKPKSENEFPKKGYIIHVPDSSGKIEYRLFRSSGGKWSTDVDGKVEPEENLLIQIKNAIIQKESSGR